jgi:O-methyltransferase
MKVRKALLKARHGGRPAFRRLIRKLLLLSAQRGYVVTRGTMEPYEQLTSEVLVDADSYAGLWDYVRRATVELLSREIGEREIAGSVAEAGVGYGEFAIVMNAFFPERNLYLFDTFSGFDQRDQSADTSLGLPQKPYETLPAATPDYVTARLPHPERAVIRAGWFPESAAGLEDETFAFVHIDLGLYSPTHAAVTWFYERLAPGGSIYVSDYNTSHTPGVKRAVREFAEEQGIGYVTLPDWSGGVVITKPHPASLFR